MGESLWKKVKAVDDLSHYIYPIIKRREKHFLLGQGRVSESISRLSVLDYATILDEME
jgi:hypothetical protein